MEQAMELVYRIQTNHGCRLPESEAGEKLGAWVTDAAERAELLSSLVAKGSPSGPDGHRQRPKGTRCSLFPQRPIVSGEGPHLALWWYGFTFECLFWGVNGKLANLFQAPCVLLV